MLFISAIPLKIKKGMTEDQKQRVWAAMRDKEGWSKEGVQHRYPIVNDFPADYKPGPKHRPVNVDSFVPAQAIITWFSSVVTKLVFETNTRIQRYALIYCSEAHTSF